MQHPPHVHVILLDTTTHTYGTRRGVEIALGVWTYRRADWCFTNPLTESIVNQIRDCVLCEHSDASREERLQIYKEAVLAYATLEDHMGYVDNQDVINCSMRILGSRTVALEILTWKPYANIQPQHTRSPTHATLNHAVHDTGIGVQQYRIQFG